jgi:hypothetical protein
VRPTVLVQVGGVCVRATFELTEASSNARVQCSGCVKGAAVELTRARSNVAPSARSNVQEYVRTSSEKYFFFQFFFKSYIQK